MRFGIKQKILLVFIAALALTTGLTALLAAYFTYRHNEQTAFADLERDLLSWQNDLQASTQRLREVALESVGDAVTLNQLTELVTLEHNLDGRPAAQAKSASLDRLHFVLRTGGFSSIAVYTGDQLSHYVSASAAGNEAAPRFVTIPPPLHLRRPSVSLILQGPHDARIEIAIPVRDVAVVVFHKAIDRAALELVARKTGKLPVLYSVDGKHRQQLTDFATAADPWHVRAAQAAIAGHFIQRTVTTNQGSFYQGLLPWHVDGKPGVILGLASSRASTLQNIHQTVAAMLGVASLVLLLSIGIGIFWIGRIIDPIEELRQRLTKQQKTVEEPLAVLGTVGAARDIGERKAAEAARAAALSEAERLAPLRNDFFSQMSHELRTPLNAILGYAQILRQDEHLTERHARGLATIADSGRRLLALIDDILDISRISASKLELHPADTNLAVFLRTVCDIVRVKADEKCLEFTCQAAPDLPAAVRVDDKRLRQVLLNLLGNAVKFTHSGRIQLRVAKLAEPGEKKGFATARLLFEIEDSGVGLTGNQLETIFLPFEQAVDAERRQGGGGLGLAISRQLVRLMGGDIQVRSELGQGSTFRFELSVPIVATGYAGARKKILVVNDDDQSRQMLPDLLKTLGFDVVEAVNGEAAIHQIQRVRPDLVVIEIAMPAMDALETLRTMRLMPELARLPVFIVSASATPKDEARSLAAGASAFIPKPMDREQLLKAVGDHLALEWIYEEKAQAPESATVDEEQTVIPPLSEMETLYKLALAGSMRDIRDYANYLKNTDPRYSSFVQRLQSLAQAYQSQAILALVERYRAQAALLERGTDLSSPTQKSSGQ